MYVMLLKTLAPCARKVRGRGESEGAPTKYIYMILHGSVKQCKKCDFYLRRFEKIKNISTQG
jgi:hypothetical protein